MATHSKKALESQWGLTDCKILGQLYLPAKYDPPPPLFAFKNALSILWHRCNKVLEIFLWDFVHTEMKRHTVGADLLIYNESRISSSITSPKGALLHWDLLTVEAI